MSTPPAEPRELLTHESGGVLTLTLNRPERRNALTPALQQQLIDALTAAAASPTVRVVVLTGAGEAFCAGLDLTVLQSMHQRSPADLDADAERVGRMFRTLFDLPVPTIAAVHGHAIAGGTGLATFTDFTLAVPSAKFGYTEAKIGFVPALVSAFLALQVGDKRARDLLLTGRLFTAAEALAYGLVTELVEPADLPTRTAQLAATLAANSPTSLRATKRLLSAQQRIWLDQAIELSIAANAASRQTHDFHEGVTAFLEKRPPHWKP